MGSSSSSEAPPSDTDAKFQARVAQIIAEESRKKDESRAAQAARDERIKTLMRDVLMETKSSSHVDESTKRNTMMMSIFTQLFALRDNDPDKSKMINFLLDMQQQITTCGSKSGDENAYLAKFIENQLETLQSIQHLKITAERKKSSGASTQHYNVGDCMAGPSCVQAKSSASVPPRQTPQSPTPPPAYSEVKAPYYDLFKAEAQTRTAPSHTHLPGYGKMPNPYEEPRPFQNSINEGGKPLQQNFPIQPLTAKENRPLQNTFNLGGKPLQQNFPMNQPPTVKENHLFQNSVNEGGKPLQQNFLNQPTTAKENRPFQNTFNVGGKPFSQQNFPDPPPSYKEAQQKQQKVPPLPSQNAHLANPLHVNRQFPDYGGQFTNKDPPVGNKNNQYQDKMSFKPNYVKNQQTQNNAPFKNNNPGNDNGPFQDKMTLKPRDRPNYVKNQQKLNNTPFKNNSPGNDNGPFLDKGPLLHGKDGGLKVDQDSDGQFYVKVPPSLMGSFPNNGPPNRGNYRGRWFNPDHNRRSESPQHTRNRYHQDRNDPNRDTARNHPHHPENQRGGGGGFQYRGRGDSRRPEQRHHFPESGPPPGGFEQQPPYGYYGQHCDARFSNQNEPGCHQPRMSGRGRGRWNNSNNNPRSFSQPRTFNASHSKERSADNLGDKPGNQTTDIKQGNGAQKWQHKGEGAFSKGKPKARKLPPKPKNPEKWPAWYAKFKNNADDSDLESVKSEPSVKTNPKVELKEDVFIAREDGIILTAIYKFKEGVYIVCEDGTIFTEIEPMGDLGTATADDKEKKKKRNKNKAKKSSTANNISMPENNTGEDSQSDGKEALMPLMGGEKEEKEKGKKEQASSPLKLLLGGLNEKALENFDPDEILGHSIVVIAKVGEAVKSFHPTTVGDLVDLKKNHPNAEVIVVS